VSWRFSWYKYLGLWEQDVGGSNPLAPDQSVKIQMRIERI
jgi:hypothetical protein